MKRVFVIGLDALSPKLAERFARDGTCPTLKRIMENGGFSKVLSAIPAQTPENWTTIATGAAPGTHGIAVWGRHNYGEPVTENHGQEAFSSNQCKSEYIWEAAGRQGLKSVISFFVGYPPTTDKAIYLDWCWSPGVFYFDICSSATYFHGDYPQVKGEKGAIQLEFKEAEGWSNLYECKSPPLEAIIDVLPKAEGKGVSYYALLLNLNGRGYDTFLLSREKDTTKALCKLKEGEWSDWFKDNFVVKGADKVGTVRFKLIELSKDGQRFQLYRSQVYPQTGFAYPPGVAEELIEKFGPYVNEEVARRFFTGLVDEKTFVEEMEYQIKWLSSAAKYLMKKYVASLYMMHWHLLDRLSHCIMGLIDPVGGRFDPAKAEWAWKVTRLGHHLADELVAEFLKDLGEEDYLVVVSDHGNAPNRKVLSLTQVVAQEGLVEIEETDGVQKVNWTRSKIFFDQTNVYINLKSRYEGGVVEDSEYGIVRDKVIDIFRCLKDQDGEYVIAFAFKKEDAPMVGLWGEHIGDIVYTYSQGFTWGVNLYGSGSTKVGGANHGPQPPTAETEISSNYATLMVVGKDIKKGYVRPVDSIGPVLTVDIVPTVSYILGMDPPRHSQGRILYDFFEAWDVSEMKREHHPLDFPSKPALIGDVTDTPP
ncbi:MAG: alkaline phosphatase family protein [Candidatus Latescibacteria bacterium]|nr:alkaline phosphatase family protein [Candidatus Latescibacterota bacterium]